MKKLVSIFLIAFALAIPSLHAQSQEVLCEEEYTQSLLTWADFSPEEKKELIKELLISGDCSFEGIKLYGKVEFVTSFPDIKIQYVDAFPDIRVQFVTAFPDECGKWQKVTSFPDFKVQIVDAFPDIKVKVVDAFPGEE